MFAHYKDGGFMSRKLWTTLFSMILLAAGALLCDKFPGMVSAYPSLCGAVVSLAAIYIGGNTATKWVVGRSPGSGPDKNEEKVSSD